MWWCVGVSMCVRACVCDQRETSGEERPIRPSSDCVVVVVGEEGKGEWGRARGGYDLSKWGKGIGAVGVRGKKKGGYFIFSWEGEGRWRKMD